MNKIEERNYSIDILRIILMFLIVMHHCIWHGYHFPVVRTPVSDYFLTLSGSFGRMATGTFFAISGYFLYNNTKIKLEKILKLLGLAFLVEITVIFFRIFAGTITYDKIIETLFYSIENYWFLLAYLIVYLLHPALNSFVSNKKIKNIVTICILYFGLISSLYINVFFTSFWIDLFFCILFYLLGIKLRDIKDLPPVWLSILISVLAVMVGVLLNINLHHLISFNNIISVLFIMMAFLKIKSEKLSIISKIIPSIVVFGVYIITEEPYIRNLLWKNDITLTIYQNNHPAAYFFLYSVIVFLISLVISIFSYQFINLPIFIEERRLYCDRKC